MAEIQYEKLANTTNPNAPLLLLFVLLLLFWFLEKNCNKCSGHILAIIYVLV